MSCVSIQAVEKELPGFLHLLETVQLYNTFLDYMYAADFAKIGARWMGNDQIPPRHATDEASLGEESSVT